MNNICYNCGKKCHFICECKYKKKEKKDDNNNYMKNANVIESKARGIVTVVSKTQIGIVTKLNMATVIKSSD